MNLIQAVILGVIQGVTEFLPVSSTGHLAMANNLLGLTEPQLAFDTFLHISTLFAVIIFFFQDLLKISVKQIKVLFVSTLPIVVVGLGFQSFFESLYGSFLVAIFLIITGFINYFSDKELQTNSQQKDISFKQGFFIGIFQSFAILPGISRSGSTLFAALKQNINRQEAFKFSFLLSVPAIIGAATLQAYTLSKTGFDGLNVIVYLFGGIGAFLSGLLSLKLLKYIIVESRLEVFAYYCWVVGGVYLLSFII